MRYVIALSTGLALTTLAAAATGQVEAQLAAERWQHRLLVLLAATPEDPKLAATDARLKPEAAGCTERDLIAWRETDPHGPLHQRFAAPKSFTALLIGKDGGEKWRSQEAVSPRQVFDLIDAMPMRLDERREQEAAPAANRTRAKSPDR